MKKYKIAIVILILAMLFTTVFTACGTTNDNEEQNNNENNSTENTNEEDENVKEENNTEEGTEEKGPLTISMTLMMGPKVEDSWVEHKIEEELSVLLEREVDIEPIMLPGWGEAQTKINLLMNDKSTMPDIGWFWGMQKEFQTWVDGGVIVDMAPYFEHGNNIVSYYAPETIFAGYSDGHIYRLPGDVAELGGRGLVIRKDWLDTLELDIPTTLDELKAVARAFTFEDPDGNGEDDTYGFGSANLGETYNLIYSLINPYGLQFVTGGWMIQDDGTIKHSQVMPEMKEALGYIRELQEEGLIDPATYSRPYSELDQYQSSELTAGILHTFVARFNPGRTMDIANNVHGANYIPIDPIEGPDGFASDPPENPYGWCDVYITNKQPDESEDLFKALNWFASIEGNKR